MAKIHWIIYVVIGLFVSILSWRLNYEKLIFFFYVGLFFILVGIIKLLISLINRKTSKKEIVHKVQHQTPKHYQRFKRCSRCGNIVSVSDSFCSKCGARV